MANYPTWVAEIGLRDGVKRDSIMSFRVPEATAKLYMAAVDKAARDATAIGLLLSAVLTVSLCAERYRRVYVEDKTAPVTNPADTVLRGNKVVVGYQSGPGNYTFTIPGRDPSAYTQNADEVTIDISATGEFADFLALVASTALGPTGLSVAATEAYLND